MTDTEAMDKIQEAMDDLRGFAFRSADEMDEARCKFVRSVNGILKLTGREG